MAKLGKAPTFRAHHIEQILDAASAARYGQRDRAILYLSAKSGLRAKELAGLQLAMLLDGRGQLVESFQLPPRITKNTGSQRKASAPKYLTVYIAAPAARRELADYIAFRQSQGAGPDSPLFVSRAGKAMSPDTLRYVYRAMCHRAGVPGRSHSGRRSFATDLDMRGVPVTRIRVLMRHSDIATTTEYIDENPERLFADAAQI